MRYDQKLYSQSTSDLENYNSVRFSRLSEIFGKFMFERTYNHIYLPANIEEANSQILL